MFQRVATPGSVDAVQDVPFVEYAALVEVEPVPPAIVTNVPLPNATSAQKSELGSVLPEVQVTPLFVE